MGNLNYMKFIKSSLLIVYILLAPMPGFAGASQGDYVVLLHGIARSANSMEKLADNIKNQGYQVLNLDYPSTKHPLEVLVEQINEQVKRFNQDPNRKIHFVSHSMGGVLVRGFLNKYRPKNLGRVVMLAPPNQGSEASDFWKDNWLFNFIYGPAGKQLITDQSKLKEFLGKINYELGVIAGDFSIDPFHSFIIPGPDDGKVSIKRTKVEGMKDHVVISATHTFIMNNKDALIQTLNFLDKGEFIKPKILNSPALISGGK